MEQTIEQTIEAQIQNVEKEEEEEGAQPPYIQWTRSRS